MHFIEMALEILPGSKENHIDKSRSVKPNPFIAVYHAPIPQTKAYHETGTMVLILEHCLFREITGQPQYLF